MLCERGKEGLGNSSVTCENGLPHMDASGLGVVIQLSFDKQPYKSAMYG